jgi:hypothetical protein
MTASPSGLSGFNPAPRTMPSGEPDDRSMPMKMPAPPEQVARDVRRIGVEGRPTDPKSGPGMMRLEMLGLLVLVVAAAGAIGLWAGWGIGMAVLAIGMLALFFNPVLMAAAVRTSERKQAVEEERGESAKRSERQETGP